MARRNLLRSLATASLLAVTGVGAVVGVAPAPAGAANSANLIIVTVRDDGFSQNDIQARVGDRLTFQLDAGAVRDHTLAWEHGQLQFHFSQGGRTSASYGPLRAGTLRFYDANFVPGPDAPGPYVGLLTVSDPPPQPPDTTSSSTSTTVTTVRPATTTTTDVPSGPTTTVYPPTTGTTGFTTIRPQLIADTPPPTTTTTTTTAPKKKDAPADKGKGKAAGTETPTTAAPAPPGPPPIEPIFDPATLTPAPLPSPDGQAAPPADGQTSDTNLDAAAVANLLNGDQPADDGTHLMLVALAALVVFLVVALTWTWHHRSSRYFPA
jgi:hypothetical protein